MNYTNQQVKLFSETKDTREIPRSENPLNLLLGSVYTHRMALVHPLITVDSSKLRNPARTFWIFPHMGTSRCNGSLSTVIFCQENICTYGASLLWQVQTLHKGMMLSLTIGKLQPQAVGLFKIMGKLVCSCFQCPLCAAQPLPSSQILQHTAKTLQV